jgi:hypothetical protein
MSNRKAVVDPNEFAANPLFLEQLSGDRKTFWEVMSLAIGGFPSALHSGT